MADDLSHYAIEDTAGSPALDEPLRSLDRAKLDIAMEALREICRIASDNPARGSDDYTNLEKIEALAGLAIYRVVGAGQ